MPEDRLRRRLVVTGVVQGVGFRPFVARLARRYGVAGRVGNDGAVVVIEAEADDATLGVFAEELRARMPPLAVVDGIETTELAPRGEAGFAIVASTRASGVSRGGASPIPPDAAACHACLAELVDPTSRRHRYAFTSCPDCGPRFVLARGTPFDRASTTMAGFRPCPACAAEYADPASRRFHHQAICCPDCGPTLEADGRRGDDALRWARRTLAGGGVVAVQGDGGVHLAVDATDRAAVGRLRAAKARPCRPLALLVADLAAAARLVELDDGLADALADPARPIVVARRRPGAAVADGVAPGTGLLGVMLAGSPTQHLLLEPGAEWSGPPVLVMTSANRAGEPLCLDIAEARRRLPGVADGWLAHDRPNLVPCDDSLVRRLGERVVPLRRSRGMVPVAIRLPRPVAPTLAMGGDLKGTVCVAAGEQAFLSQHLGDHGTLEARRSATECIGWLLELTGVVPEQVAVDAHPGYASASLGRAFGSSRGLPVVEVFHHHAHLAALAAEHGLAPDEPLVGIAADGVGYGPDGTVWGGELLVAGPGWYERAGHLAPMRLPGGDAAVRTPARVALSWLHAVGLDWSADLPCAAAVGEIEREVLARQLGAGTACVTSTSLGRLMDAVSSLLGVCHLATYEAQAAIELEALATAASDGPPLRCRVVGGVIDPAPLLGALVHAVRAGEEPGPLARAAHRAIAEALAETAASLAADRGIRRVGLSGGVWQNGLLAAWVPERLAERGLEVLAHRRVPPNDAGLSLGQVVIAGMQH